MTSVMQGVLEFLGDIGLFDVLLPFILVYVMVYALLERTELFGVETIVLEKGEKPVRVTKRNLNAMFAFAVGFFTLLSARIVSTIHRAVGPLMILLFMIILIILFVSVFRTKEGMHEFSKGWMTFFVWFIVLATVFIFLASIQTTDGVSWLEWAWGYATTNTNSSYVGAIILLVLVGGFIMWLGSAPAKPAEEKKP